MLTEFLRECRKRKGFTQKEVGEKISYKSRTVSRWENGQLVPSEHAIIALAKLYEMKENEIYQFFEFVGLARSRTTIAHIKRVCLPHLNLFKFRGDVSEDDNRVRLVIGEKNRLGL